MGTNNTFYADDTTGRGNNSMKIALELGEVVGTGFIGSNSSFSFEIKNLTGYADTANGGANQTSEGAIKQGGAESAVVDHYSADVVVTVPINGELTTFTFSNWNMTNESATPNTSLTATGTTASGGTTSKQATLAGAASTNGAFTFTYGSAATHDYFEASLAISNKGAMTIAAGTVSGNLTYTAITSANDEATGTEADKAVAADVLALVTNIATGGSALAAGGVNTLDQLYKNIGNDYSSINSGNGIGTEAAIAANKASLAVQLAATDLTNSGLRALLDSDNAEQITVNNAGFTAAVAPTVQTPGTQSQIYEVSVGGQKYYAVGAQNGGSFTPTNFYLAENLDTFDALVAAGATQANYQKYMAGAAVGAATNLGALYNQFFTNAANTSPSLIYKSGDNYYLMTTGSTNNAGTPGANDVAGGNIAQIVLNGTEIDYTESLYNDAAAGGEFVLVNTNGGTKQMFANATEEVDTVTSFMTDDAAAKYSGKLYLQSGGDYLIDNSGATISGAFISYTWNAEDGIQIDGIYSDNAFSTKYTGATYDTVEGGATMTVGGMQYTLSADTYSDVVIEAVNDVEFTKAQSVAQGDHDTIRVYYTDIAGQDIIRTNYNPPSATIGAGLDDTDPFKGENSGKSAANFEFGSEKYAATIVSGEVTAIQHLGATTDTAIEGLSAYTIPGATTSYTFSDATTGYSFTATTETGVGLTIDVSGTTLTIASGAGSGTGKVGSLTFTASYTDNGEAGLSADDEFSVSIAGGAEPTTEPGALVYTNTVLVDATTYYVGVDSTISGTAAKVYTDNTFTTESSSAIEFTFVDTDEIAGNNTEYFTYTTGGTTE